MPTSPLPNCSVSPPPADGVVVLGAMVVLLSLSLPQAARKAAAAAEPPVSAMNLRRETGSFTAWATAPDAGRSGLSRSVLSDMSPVSSLGVCINCPYASAVATRSQSGQKGPSLLWKQTQRTSAGAPSTGETSDSASVGRFAGLHRKASQSGR